MKGKIWIVVVIALIAIGGLYSLPRVVVSSQQRNLKTYTDTTQVATADTNNTAAEVHETTLSAEQKNTLNQLTVAYNKAGVGVAKAKAAFKLSDFYTNIRKFDSAAKYAEYAALANPTEANFVKAGDKYYDAFSFAVDSKKSATLGEKARQWYQKALDGNASLLNVKANMAMTYISTSTPMQGIMMLREVLKDDPTNEVALFNMGLLSMRSNQYEKAIERFRQLLKVRPNNTKAQFYLAVSLAQTGKNQEALEQLQQVKSLEKDPTIQAAIAELEKELK